MDVTLRIVMYMIIITLVREIISKKNNDEILEDNIIRLPNYSRILKICAMIFLSMIVILEFIYRLLANGSNRSVYTVMQIVFLLLAILVFMFAVYIETTSVKFNHELIVEKEFLFPEKKIYYCDIVSCERLEKKYEIISKSGEKIVLDANLDNVDNLIRQIKKNGISVQSIINKGYVVKAKTPIVILLDVFLVVALWIDIVCIRQGINPGIKGIFFASISPVFLFIFCKNKYYIADKTITKKFLFFSVKTIEFSAIDKVVVQKDWMDGRHLKVYVIDKEKPVFDIDSSYLDTAIFEEDIKRRHKKIVE